MAEQWYYTHGAGRERIGPVGKDELKAVIASGQVDAQALVWRVGMPQWAPASSVPGLLATPEISDGAPAGETAAFETAAAPTAGAFAPSPSPRIDYYSGPGGLPPRAAATLAGHARPTGDTNVWPLNDLLMTQWDHAFALRKKINGAAQLFRALLLLSIIATVIFGLIGLGSLGSRSSRNEAMIMLILTGVFGGISVLYFFLWRATYRSKRWAPLTFFILSLISILSSVANIGLAVFAGPRGGSATATATAMGGFFGVLITAAFAVVAWRAYAAIPDFLMQPAWCQELLVKSKL